jgi:Superinfection immunity protein
MPVAAYASRLAPSGDEFVTGLEGILFLISLHFLPTMVAVARRHRSRLAIFLVNFLLGWTVIGWIVAMIWACTGNTEAALLRRSQDLQRLPNTPTAANPPDFAGMTVNERLNAAGLTDPWGVAARTRNRDQMLDILKRVEIANPAFTVDAVLADPQKYGF